MNRLDEPYELYQQATSLMEKQRYEEAIALFRRSADASPHYKTLERLGECFIRQGRLLQAIEPLAAATTLGKAPRAPTLLAEALLKIEPPDPWLAKHVLEIARQRVQHSPKIDALAQEVKRVLRQREPEDES